MVLILSFIVFWVGAKVPWKEITMDIIHTLTNSI
jgi:hypothetical protein